MIPRHRHDVLRTVAARVLLIAVVLSLLGVTAAVGAVGSTNAVGAVGSTNAVGAVGNTNAVGAVASTSPAADVGTVAVGQSASDANGIGFRNESYRVEPPETAEIGLDVPDGGLFRVIVDSPGDHFSVEVTAGYSADGSTGGSPTVRLDTGNVSSEDPADYLSVANARVHRITVHENEVDEGHLPGGEYDVRAIRGSERAETTLAVAPSVSLSFEEELRRSDLERDPVRTITGETDLAPGEQLEIRVTSTGRDAFRIATRAVVAGDGSFETTIDLRPVPAGASFEVTVHHDNVTRARRSPRLYGDLPEPVGGRQASDGITFAYEGDQLVLEATSDQSITGETALEEGTVITIILRSPDSHLHVTTTEVDRYGTFEVTADLGGLQPRRDVIVSAIADGDASGAAPVAIVEPDEGDHRGSDDGTPDDTTEGMLLDDPGNAGGVSGTEPHLAPGFLAIGLGVLLSVVASGLLLGVDRSAISSQRQ